MTQDRGDFLVYFVKGNLYPAGSMFSSVPQLSFPISDWTALPLGGFVHAKRTMQSPAGDKRRCLRNSVSKSAKGKWAAETTKKLFTYGPQQETEFPRHLRSQSEIGNEEKKVAKKRSFSNLCVFASLREINSGGLLIR